MYPVKGQMTMTFEDALLTIQRKILAIFAPMPKEQQAWSSCAFAVLPGTFDQVASITTTLQA